MKKISGEKSLDTVPQKGKDCELFFVLSNLSRIKEKDFGVVQSGTHRVKVQHGERYMEKTKRSHLIMAHQW